MRKVFVNSLRSVVDITAQFDSMSLGTLTSITYAVQVGHASKDSPSQWGVSRYDAIAVPGRLGMEECSLDFFFLFGFLVWERGCLFPIAYN